jgi:hypothetical protein
VAIAADSPNSCPAPNLADMGRMRCAARIGRAVPAVAVGVRIMIADGTLKESVESGIKPDHLG